MFGPNMASVKVAETRTRDDGVPGRRERWGRGARAIARRDGRSSPHGSCPRGVHEMDAATPPRGHALGQRGTHGGMSPGRGSRSITRLPHPLGFRKPGLDRRPERRFVDLARQGLPTVPSEFTEVERGEHSMPKADASVPDRRRRRPGSWRSLSVMYSGRPGLRVDRGDDRQPPDLRVFHHQTPSTTGSRMQAAPRGPRDTTAGALA
jgi:hypothetical protein